MTTTEPDYMTTYRETWADLVETDGKLDLDKVARELSDYGHLLHEVPLAYDAVTGGRLSKPNTAHHHVENAAKEYSDRLAAALVMDDLLPLIEYGADRQAVIDYAMALDEESYSAWLDAQARKASVQRAASRATAERAKVCNWIPAGALPPVVCGVLATHIGRSVGYLCDEHNALAVAVGAITEPVEGATR